MKQTRFSADRLGPPLAAIMVSFCGLGCPELEKIVQGNIGLEVTPRELDFGTTATDSTLTLVNTGDREFRWTADPDPRITVEPISEVLPPGIEYTVRVTIDRTGLEALYQGALEFTYEGESLTVIVKVLPSGAPAVEIVGGPEPGSTIRVDQLTVDAPVFAPSFGRRFLVG